MITQKQQEFQQVKQQESESLQEVTPCRTQIPDSWQLTKEQKDFIDLFSEDDHIKP